MNLSFCTAASSILKQAGRYSFLNQHHTDTNESEKRCTNNHFCLSRHQILPPRYPLVNKREYKASTQRTPKEQERTELRRTSATRESEEEACLPYPTREQP